MSILETKMLNNEYWWGGSVVFSDKQPYDSETIISISLQEEGFNQASPIFISSMGRVIHTDTPTKISFENGLITIDGDNPI